MGWIGVDLDGTLAHYDGWRGDKVIGDPVPVMAARVKWWLSRKKDVRIFTARVHPTGQSAEEIAANIKTIQDWCVAHFGQALPVVCSKDLQMIELWDDRAVQVVTNTGMTATHQAVADAVERFRKHKGCKVSECDDCENWCDEVRAFMGEL